MIAQRYNFLTMNARGEDPLVRKLMLKERAEEDIYFAARDRQLLAELHAAQEEEQLRHVRERTRMCCPECGARLERHPHDGVAVDACPAGHGLWMKEAALQAVARRERHRERDPIARYLYPLKPVV